MNIAENDRTWRMITVSISTIITGNTVASALFAFPASSILPPISIL